MRDHRQSVEVEFCSSASDGFEQLLLGLQIECQMGLLFAMAGRAPEIIESSDGVHICVHDLGGPNGGTPAPLLFSHATGFHRPFGLSKPSCRFDSVLLIWVFRPAHSSRSSQ